MGIQDTLNSQVRYDLYGRYFETESTQGLVKSGGDTCFSECSLDFLLSIVPIQPWLHLWTSPSAWKTSLDLLPQELFK